MSIIAITAALYAVGKALTGPIPFAYSVGEVLIAIFIPAFLAVVSETVPVAVGAGIGTFLGDYFVRTTPALSLIAGVPANFIAILLFGLFVKRYKSWSAFVAAAVAFVTLGDLIAAVNLVLYLQLPAAWILGFVVAWNITGIPAIIVMVPVLVRSVRPLLGRSRILTYSPEWSGIIGKRQLALSLFFPLLYVLLGLAVYLLDSSGISPLVTPGLGAAGVAYFGIAAVLILVFGPLSSVIGGSRRHAESALP